MTRGSSRASWGRGWRDAGACSALRGFLLRASLLSLGVVLAACVKPMVANDYEADPRAARMNADEARDFLSSALGPECARIAKANATPTGEAKVTVQVTPSGDVVKSHLSQRSGDDRIDELFGQTASRMKFDANPTQSANYTGRLRMGYSCNGSAAVGTIDMF